MDKSPDAFRSIGEVARLVGVAPHVLRYWETQFSQISPVKRSDGRRYYRPEDLRLIAGLCQVLREEGLSIRGARRLIASDRGSKLRQIGARRLGEIRGEFQAAAAQDGAVHDTFIAGSAQQAGDDQPPSPAADWLGRLCASAAFLHRARASGTPLPPGIAPLRDRLRQARG
ncbi:MerR family transcriptional regulator [Paracoccus yeei]|uniref:MerR family transcriptional regulator n=1 Tax=Paracoccus yeei TaxID=147645 RepID=A0A5P2QUX7_9RHOB|nr:MerR family transcriptional regulator [Paracoccus yeei]QEU09755.1 MerR family transcriptional regulator [Paracoccus yeei]